MAHVFFGGVHPKDNKSLTQGLAVTPMEAPPAQVALSMSMHIGPPCVPTVAVGDTVMVGQEIGRPVGLGAPIHASISGLVVAVEPRSHVSGTPVMAVVIDNDGTNTIAPPLERPAPVADLTPEQIIALIEKAGITGMGGAGFPTHVKIRSGLGKVDTVLLNGAECEPYITSDHRLMVEHPHKVIEGARLIMRTLGLDKCTIGIESNKPDAIAALRALTPLRNGDVTVAALRVRYPQGSEKQLIQKITGRQVPPGGLPSDVGCAVFNVVTAAAIYDAVVDGKPVTERIVTISGKGVCTPKNLLVPLGVSLSTLIDEAGGTKGMPGRILCGGPMMGVAQYDLAASVTKATNALLVMSRKEFHVTPKKELVCLHCGKCSNACPMHLTPLFLYQHAECRRFDELERYHLMDCIECGSCAFSCPAHIPLVQSIRVAKSQVRKQQAAAQAVAKRLAEETAEAAQAPEKTIEKEVQT